MSASQNGLWLFAGSNGAGKSTFINDATGPDGPIAGMPILNPDWRTKDLLRTKGYEDYSGVPDEIYKECFVQAAGEMERQASDTLAGGGTVCIETVLSTQKYLRLVDVAQRAEVPFYLVYIFLKSPELACQRVAARVSRGGHPVPADKIVSRYHRSIENLPIFAARSTEFWVYDNSDSNAGNKPNDAAGGKMGRLDYFDLDTPNHVLHALFSLPLGPSSLE